MNKKELIQNKFIKLTYTIIEMTKEPFKEIIRPSIETNSCQIRSWDHDVIERILDLTKPDDRGRAVCPLCGDRRNPTGDGFSYPNGLRRHLEGSHSSVQCGVIDAVVQLHSILNPGCYGPFNIWK